MYPAAMLDQNQFRNEPGSADAYYAFLPQSFVCVHVTGEIKAVIKACRIWINIFPDNNDPKNIRGWKMNRRPVMWGNLSEMRASGGFSVLFFCVSVHLFQCSWLKTTQHADTVPEYASFQFSWRPSGSQLRGERRLLMTMHDVESSAPIH